MTSVTLSSSLCTFSPSQIPVHVSKKVILTLKLMSPHYCIGAIRELNIFLTTWLIVLKQQNALCSLDRSHASCFTRLSLMQICCLIDVNTSVTCECGDIYSPHFWHIWESTWIRWKSVPSCCLTGCRSFGPIRDTKWHFFYFLLDLFWRIMSRKCHMCDSCWHWS